MSSVYAYDLIWNRVFVNIRPGGRGASLTVTQSDVDTDSQEECHVKIKTKQESSHVKRQRQV